MSCSRISWIGERVRGGGGVVGTVRGAEGSVLRVGGHSSVFY